MTSDQLAMKFVNQSGFTDDEVFITFQNGQRGHTDFKVVYGSDTPVSIGASDLMSESLSLTEIGPDGLTIDRMVSIVVYVSYGSEIKSRISAPAFIGSGTDIDTQFQTFEITMTGNPGDQGDLTAINYFTAPLRIESRDSEGNVLQSAGYRDTADAVAVKLGAAATPPWSNLLSSPSGYRVRFIGPSSYGASDPIPYPSFIPYVKAVHTAGQKTTIINSNAFIYQSKDGEKTNYIFTLNHTASAQPDGSIILTGDITTTITGTTTTSGPTFKDCGLVISASNAASYNTTIYGQVITNATSFTGDGWNDFTKYAEACHLSDQGAVLTTQNLLIGEITTGLLLGLVNSDTIPNGKTVPLKDMSSQEWWTLSPLPAFAKAQPDHPFYNTYAGALFAASDNEVYSIPYSDRLGTGPLVNSVSFGGKHVASWTVTILPPIATPA